jgi:response regulator RpfG family c-di-GMP phosphodiesterase
MEIQVLYIEKEKFLRQLFELMYKQKGEKIFAVEEISTNRYLVDDLQPKMIIFDLDSVDHESLEFLLGLNNVKLVATGPKERSQEVESRISLYLSKPIEVHGLYEQLSKITCS